LDELTDILKIPKFFILTHSCGSCYALAAYPQLKDKILGSIRMLAMWTPTNLPCMPTSYAITRSLPTSIARAWYSVSLAAQSTPFSHGNSWQLGPMSLREESTLESFASTLEKIGIENASSDYKACESDWLLSLEITKKMNIPFNNIDVPIRCWHGMDDTIIPLGSVMWIQREMKRFLLFAVEGATHNIHMDMSIIRAVFSDIVKEATDIRLSSFAQNSLQSLQSSQGEM
jgi:pimeloyl-ACP methyl ester carboxylesterase